MAKKIEKKIVGYSVVDKNVKEQAKAEVVQIGVNNLPRIIPWPTCSYQTMWTIQSARPLATTRP